MKSIKHQYKVFISVLILISFPATTTWAKDNQVKYAPRGTLSKTSSTSQIIVERAFEKDIPKLKQKYEKETGKDVVPIVMTEKEAQTIGVITKTYLGMEADDKTRYAQREAQAQHLQNYEGGDVVVAASLGSILLIAAIVLLIVLIVD